MFNPSDVAKVAIQLYAVETLSLKLTGPEEIQTLTPEQFVPGALRLLLEAHRAVAEVGVVPYLEAAAAFRAQEA